MRRKETQWKCQGCGESMRKPYTPRHEYTSQKLVNGEWVKTTHTLAMQRAEQQRCYDCDGSGTLAAYDVKTVKQLNSLAENEWRRVAQQIDALTPYPVVAAVLQQATSALNHEDEDYIPAINVAITLLRKGE